MAGGRCMCTCKVRAYKRRGRLSAVGAYMYVHGMYAYAPTNLPNLHKQPTNLRYLSLSFINKITKVVGEMSSTCVECAPTWRSFYGLSSAKITKRTLEFPEIARNVGIIGRITKIMHANYTLWTYNA